MKLPPLAHPVDMMATADPDEQYFRSIPWCSKLLDDPNFVIIPSLSRQPKESTEDSLFAETLKTDDTIGAMLSLCKRPSSEVARIDEVRSLLSLGYRVNGYPTVCHGGIVATLLDEVMGSLVLVNNKLEDLETSDTVVTAYLKVNYLKPVQTPQTVLVTAHFKEIVGRKYYIEGSVQDYSGTVLASGEALWLRQNSQREKL